MYWKTFIVVLVFCGVAYRATAANQKWEDILPSALPDTQAKAVYDLLDRIKHGLGQQFEIDIGGPDAAPQNKDKVSLFKEKDGDKVKVVANTGVSATWGIHYYLKHNCGCHFSWDTIQIDSKKSKTSSSPDAKKYIFLSSTSCHSAQCEHHTGIQRKIQVLPECLYPWLHICILVLGLLVKTHRLDGSQWHQPAIGFHSSRSNLDQSLYKGVEMPGTRAIHCWPHILLSQLGLTEKDLDAHFSGPAFLPWQRMGNMEQFGRPLPPSWHNFTIELQHQVHLS